MTLVWRPGFQFDADASTYIEAVEVADGQALETGVRYAINDFVIGCKQDGIWDAIKASCILAGARTLAGALVPLVGAAPTNYNFVAGNYDRETGLLGDGSTKSLNSNRTGNADPQNSRHLSVYATSLETTRINPALIGCAQLTFNGRSFLTVLNNASPRGVQSSLGNLGATNSALASDVAPGFIGISRGQPSSYSLRFNNTDLAISQTSEALSPSDIKVFARDGSPNDEGAHRLSFYSIGESLDLAALDTRVSNLITAIGAAIP